MNRIALSAAFGPYDRVEPLRTGEVRPEGIDLSCLTLDPPEIFYRMCRYREFEVSEMSMGKVVSLRSQDDNRMIAIPVFDLVRAMGHAAA